MSQKFRLLIALFAVFAMVAAACGDDDDGEPTSAGAPAQAADDAPTVVVTTNILGDVVENLVGDQMNVVTIMPVGADPHDFQPSAQEVAEITEATVLIVNGEAFEEGLLDVIESAEDDGVQVFEATSAITTIEFGEGGHDHGDEHDDEGDEHDDEGHEDEAHEDEGHEDEHADEGHDEHDDEGHEGEGHDDEHKDEEDDHGHEDEHGHDHSGADPHFFTDPARMADAADAIADFLIANVEGIDAEALRSTADAYVAELRAADAAVEERLAGVPEESRVLITNHEVFGYFADRYDFEVAGAVIPGGSTIEGTSAQDLAELVETVEEEGVLVIFSDTSASGELAQTLADEVGDVAVVELFTESLGDEGSGGATYIEMVETNADRIATALGG